jgi:DNA-directed RNA polymerase I, II, and III subunit RPABC2
MPRSKRTSNISSKEEKTPDAQKIKPARSLSSRRSRKSKKSVVQVAPKKVFDDDAYLNEYEDEAGIETLIETLSGKLKFHIFNPDKYEIETYRNILIVPPDHRKTSEVMTEYEFAEIISHRAKQIENDSPVYVDVGNETDPIKMAEMELLQKKCPLSIRRVHNNLVAEIWHANEMVLP